MLAQDGNHQVGQGVFCTLFNGMTSGVVVQSVNLNLAFLVFCVIPIYMRMLVVY